jgi:hypothetical protein
VLKAHRNPSNLTSGSYCCVVIRTKSNKISCIANINTKDFLGYEACIFKPFNIKRTSTIVIELSTKSQNTCSVSVRSSLWSNCKKCKIYFMICINSNKIWSLNSHDLSSWNNWLNRRLIFVSSWGISQKLLTCRGYCKISRKLKPLWSSIKDNCQILIGGSCSNSTLKLIISVIYDGNSRYVIYLRTMQFTILTCF